MSSQINNEDSGSDSSDLDISDEQRAKMERKIARIEKEAMDKALEQEIKTS